MNYGFQNNLIVCIIEVEEIFTVYFRDRQHDKIMFSVIIIREQMIMSYEKDAWIVSYFCSRVV